MGDQIHIGGDAINTAIGWQSSVNARDLITQIQKSDLGNDLKKNLAKATEMVEALDVSENDKAGVMKNVNDLSEELQKPAAEKSRVSRLWGHIKEVAPTIASLLESSVSIAKLLSGNP